MKKTKREKIELLDFKHTDLIPFLMAERGMGKTQYVKDYAKKNNLKLFTLNLSAIESSDFTGLPYIDNKVTKYSKPEFLNLKNAILFFDEMNRVNDNDVKSALHNLIIDREINGHKLDKSVIIVGAGNPTNEDYETNEFDESLKDRIVIFNFEYSFDDFLKYLKKIATNNFTKFVENNVKIFENISRRRIVETNKIYQITKNDNYIHNFLGTEVFNLFNAFNSKRLFNLDNILAGERTNDVVGIQSALDDLAQYLTTSFDTKKAKNINKFLTNINAELKLIFFKKIKDSDLKEEQINIFIESGLFKNLGKYLKELF